jgi:hypothetical protein
MKLIVTFFSAKKNPQQQHREKNNQIIKNTSMNFKNSKLSAFFNLAIKQTVSKNPSKRLQF